jgi:SAM-dependent methyltransferase
MILSALTKFKTVLARIKPNLSLQHSVDRKHSLIRFLEANHANPDYDRRIRALRGLYKDILAIDQQIQQEVDSLIVQLDSDIAASADKILFADWNIDLINHKQMVSPDIIDSSVMERIGSRIKGYCDWHYAALQIGCRSKFWTDLMVTADPLYLTNSYDGYLQTVVSGYPTEYQSRLRVYCCPVKDLMKHLPKGQFSFILCWNTLEYVNQTEIENLLSIVRHLLKPGGIFMFSYNNCDTETGAHLAEIVNMSYVNRTQLIDRCQQLGYEIVADESHELSHELYQNVSWLELKLPGTLTTTKAHQVIGKIKEK